MQAVVNDNVEEHERAVHIPALGITLAFCHVLTNDYAPTASRVERLRNRFQWTNIFREWLVVAVHYDRFDAIGHNDGAISIELRFRNPGPIVIVGKEAGMHGIFRSRRIEVRWSRIELNRCRCHVRKLVEYRCKNRSLLWCGSMGRVGREIL